MVKLDWRTLYVLGVGRVETGRAEAHKRNAAATKKRKAEEKEAKRVKGIPKIEKFARRRIGSVAPGRCCHGNTAECKGCAEAARTGALVVDGKRLEAAVP